MARFYAYAGTVLLTVLVAYSIPTASAASRSDVTSSVVASCTTDQEACLKAVNDQIASIGRDCSVQSLNEIRGLADATTAVSKTNAALGTLMAEAVAKNAVGCAQVAFGAVLDGTGTAAIVVPVQNAAASPG